MFEIFDQIASAIQFAFQYVANLIGSLFNVLIFAVEAVKLPVQLSGYLHPVLGGAILITLAIGVAKFITGR